MEMVTGPKTKFADIYSELALNQAALRAYTKPLFTWKKALGQSHDGLTLYDFARCTSSNLKQIHRQLMMGANPEEARRPLAAESWVERVRRLDFVRAWLSP